MTAERIQNLVATPHKVEVRETEFPRQLHSQSGDWEREEMARLPVLLTGTPSIRDYFPIVASQLHS